MSKENQEKKPKAEETEPTEFERFEALAKGLLRFKKPAPEIPPEPKKGPRKKHE